MNGRIIFLLEEPSMKALLDVLLPRLFPGWVENQSFQCISHEGKSDLDKSIPRKLTAWREPGVRFVIVRDNDNGDCIQLKNRLSRLCSEAKRPDSLVRIVCQELESWYIGDLRALGAAFPEDKVDTPAMRKRYVSPDSWQKPSLEVKRLAPSFQKLIGARAMGKLLNPENNRSLSFRKFVDGVAQMIADQGYDRKVAAAD